MRERLASYDLVASNTRKFLLPSQKSSLGPGRGESLEVWGMGVANEKKFIQLDDWHV